MDTLSVPSSSTNLAIVSSYDAFVNYARSIPMLSEEREQQLFAEYQKTESIDAAKEIILSHLRFVVHIANSYRGYGLAMEDVVQEGNIGLMKSVKKFDPNYGVRFASFAVHWVKSEINEFILKNWRLVKVATSKARRKLFFNLRSLKQKLAWLTDEEAANVASELGVEVEDVRAVECNLYQEDKAFDPSYGEADDDSCSYAFGKVLEDHSQSPEKFYFNKQESNTARNALIKAIHELDPRSRDIIESRFLQAPETKINLEELGERYGITAERVRQIENRTVRKLREILAQNGFEDSSCFFNA